MLFDKQRIPVHGEKNTTRIIGFTEIGFFPGHYNAGHYGSKQFSSGWRSRENAMECVHVYEKNFVGTNKRWKKHVSRETI